MLYFIPKPGIKHYVFLFENTGKRIGILKIDWAIKLIDNGGYIVTTFDRINEIRKLNGLKPVKEKSVQ